MSAILSAETESAFWGAAKLVIPVRYVAGGAVVQTTSTALYSDAIHVRSVRPPEPGRVVGLQLYFPNFKEAVAPLSIVAERTSGANPGFWAEFAGNDGAKDRIAALLALHRERPNRSCRRFHTHLQASIRQRGQPHAIRRACHEHQPDRGVRAARVAPSEQSCGRA